jgi:hypothetical protein
MQDNVIYIQFGDKSMLPEGPWNSEPDFVKFTYLDLPCIIVRDISLGHYVAGVGVKRTHPFFKKSVDTIINLDLSKNIFIHGGLSLAGKLPRHLSKYNKNTWWIGFSCSDEDDCIPIIDADHNGRISKNDLLNYKNFKYVKSEVKRLARQLIKISK